MQKIDITPEREDYFSKRGKVILSACPGSGKTTVLTYKLQQLIEEVTRKHGKYAGVLCLSFTNVAKEEVLEKYRSLHNHNLNFPSEVSTINSFINNYITLPFYRILSGKEIRPQILEDEEFDKVITSHIHFRAYTINNKTIYYIYPPSKFKFDATGALVAPHKLDNPRDERVFQAYAKKIKELQLEHCIFKNDHSVFMANQIIQKVPRIGKLLTKKFPYILVDEAQDTSEEQLLLLQKLFEIGLDGLELVGDYYQSLYEWRDARPDLFYNLMTDESWQACELTDCRRSVQPIIDVYSLIRNDASPHIHSTINDSQCDNPVQVILYGEDNVVSAVHLYESLAENFDNKKVLVRGKALLNALRGNYTSNSPWKEEFPMDVMTSYVLLKKGKTKLAINTLRAAYVKLKNPDSKYRERTLIESELKANYKFNSHLLSFIKKMPPTTLALLEWTEVAERYFTECFELDEYSFDLKQGVWRSKHGISLDEIFGIEESPIKSEISTIHGVKGMTLQSVLLVLDATTSTNSLTINDLKKCEAMPSEKQRLLYVALSRPESLLILGIPKNSCTRERVVEIFGEVVVHEL